MRRSLRSSPIPVLSLALLGLTACGDPAPPAGGLDASRRDTAPTEDAFVETPDAFVDPLDAPTSPIDAPMSAIDAPTMMGDAPGASVDAFGLDGSPSLFDARVSFDARELDAGFVPTDADGGFDAAMTPDAGTDAAVVACTGLAPVAGDGRAEARFGTSRWSAQFSGNFVSLSGDTAVVGNEGVWGTSAGYVRVFTWDGCADTWSMQAELVGARTTRDDAFGSAVALDGDTLAVGANMRPDTSNTGAVHLFTRTGTTWTEATMPIYPPTATGGRFGRALGLHGNVLAIGAPYGKDPSSAVTYTGVVVVYTRGPGGRFTMADLFVGSGAVRDDAFGYSLHLDADTMVVGGPGAFNDSVVPARRGKAWIFTDSGGTWTEAAALTASDGANGDWFGRSVARANDVVIVGAPRHDLLAGDGSTLTDAGSVYVFTRTAGVWAESARITASDASADARFGFTVGMISSDRFVVGAAGSGRLYTFTRASTGWSEDAAVHTVCGDALGYALDVDGQLALTGRPTGVLDLADLDDTCL